MKYHIIVDVDNSYGGVNDNQCHVYNIEITSKSELNKDNIDDIFLKALNKGQKISNIKIGSIVIEDDISEENYMDSDSYNDVLYNIPNEIAEILKKYDFEFIPMYDEDCDFEYNEDCDSEDFFYISNDDNGYYQCTPRGYACIMCFLAELGDTNLNTEMLD